MVLPNISLLPAFVAAFLRVLIMQRPGRVNLPLLFISLAAMVAKLSSTAVVSFLFKLHASATAWARAPLDMALLAAFVAFIWGAMLWARLRALLAGRDRE